MAVHSLGEAGDMLVGGKGRRVVSGWRGNFFVELGCTMTVVDHKCRPLSIGKKKDYCEKFYF